MKNTFKRIIVAMATILMIVMVMAPMTKISEGYVVDDYSIVMGTDGALNWSTIPSEVVPVEYTFVTVSRNQMYDIYYDLIINYIKSVKVFDTIIEISQVPYDLSWLKTEIINKLTVAPQSGALIFMGHTTNKTYTPFIYRGGVYTQAHRPFPENWAVSSSLTINSQTEIAPITRSTPVYQLPSLVIAVGCHSAGSFNSYSTITDDVNKTLKDIYSWMGTYRLSLLDTPSYYWYGRGFVGFLTLISPVYNDPWALDFIDNVLYYSISKGYSLGNAVILASFNTGTGYSVLLKYYRNGRLYPALFLNQYSNEVALFVGYFDTYVDPIPNSTKDINMYASIATEEIKKHSSTIYELFDTVIHSATKIIIKSDSDNGLISVDWYVRDGFIATAKYIKAGSQLEMIGFEITVPRDELNKLNINKDALLMSLKKIILEKINKLPQWVAVENASIPGTDYMGELYLTVNGMRLGIIDEDRGSIQTNLGIFYTLADTRYGVGIVYYDNTKLISHILSEVRPTIISPQMSIEEAKQRAWETIEKLMNGRPNTVTADNALALIMPNGTIIPVYVVRAVEESSNYTATVYFVMVNMANGKVAYKEFNMEILGTSVTTIDMEDGSTLSPTQEGGSISSNTPTTPSNGKNEIYSAIIAVVSVSAGVIVAALIKPKIRRR